MSCSMNARPSTTNSTNTSYDSVVDHLIPHRVLQLILIKNGKLHSALDQLTDGQSGCVLHSDEKVGSKTVLEILKEKHPATAPLHVESIIMDTPPIPPHPIQFESLTRQVIRRAALNTHGSAGPSSVDADTWRRMCTAFSDVSDQLCEAIAACARRLAAMYVD